MRLIDADAVVKDLEWQMDTHNPDWSWTNSAMCYDLIEYLDKVPTAEPKRGKWIEDKDYITRCSVCGKEAYWEDKSSWYDDWEGESGYVCFDFCPYCGADMRGDSKCD